MTWLDMIRDAQDRAKHQGFEITAIRVTRRQAREIRQEFEGLGLYRTYPNLEGRPEYVDGVEIQVAQEAPWGGPEALDGNGA